MARPLLIALFSALTVATLLGPATAQIRLNPQGGDTRGGEVAQPGSGKETPSGSADMIDGTSIETIAAVFRDRGYKAEVDKVKDGSPRITSAASGTGFRVLSYMCNRDSNRICSLEFHAYWSNTKNPMSLQKVNSWSKKYRFFRVYIDDDNDIALRFSLDLEGGVTKLHMAHTVERWADILGDFDKYVKER